MRNVLLSALLVAGGASGCQYNKQNTDSYSPDVGSIGGTPHFNDAPQSPMSMPSTPMPSTPMPRATEPSLPMPKGL
jgi:hypothetical protein